MCTATPAGAWEPLGERLAADHLARAATRSSSVNFRTRYGELDLVAADERHLVFCEVKSRVAGAAGTGEPARARSDAAEAAAAPGDGREWLAASDGRRRTGPTALRRDRHRRRPGGRLLALEHLENAF